MVFHDALVTRTAHSPICPFNVQKICMPKAVLTLSSKNYGACALRGWLMAKWVRLDFMEKTISPDDPSMRAEMHSGFSALRASLPMNIKAHFSGFKIWSRAQTDIDRILLIWQECLGQYGGPYLVGQKPSLADAMFAPVVTRFRTYDVKLDAIAQAYSDVIMALPEMQERVFAAQAEPNEIDELDAEF